MKHYFTKERIKAFLIFSIIIALFLVVSYYSKNIYDTNILQGKGYIWMFVYFLLVILEIILGFVSAIPLIPLAVNIWGVIPTFILTLTGRVVGSALIFYISRKFGLDLIAKLISLNKLNKYQEKIPKQNLFIWVVLIRLILPIDIISYAIALFTKIRFWPYIIATTIGFIPWTLLLVLFGDLNFKIQMILIGAGITLFAIIFIFLKNRKNNHN